MKEIIFRRLVVPVVTLLLQGITPTKIALSLALGIGLGIFPVLGTTMVLCTLAALVWRLNLIAIQTVHFAMTPVQLLLIIPFVRLGEYIVHAEHGPLSMRAGLDLFSAGAGHALLVLRDAILHAVIGWIVLGPLVILVLYCALAPLLERLALRLRNPGTSLTDTAAK
jgi:uncharacterized protein (DUF2062 family)